jgi:tRNA threonylcarbamoyladenosine biosynthesis protein TsaE
MEFVVENIYDLPAVAKSLLDNLGETTVVAFDGQMGAGKTTFIQNILRAMGIENTHGSPTYSLVNEYKSPFYGSVFHFDLYRLNSEEEAFDIGIEEMIYGGGICFIEWPDKVLHLLPENTLYVKIRLNEDLNRVFSWEEVPQG